MVDNQVEAALAQQIATLQTKMQGVTLDGTTSLELFREAREMLGQMRALIDSVEATLNDAEMQAIVTPAQPA